MDYTEKCISIILSIFLSGLANTSTMFFQIRRLTTLLSGWVIALVCLTSQAAAEPVLIHHPDLKGESLTTPTLVRVYAMQKRVWSDSTPVKVFTLPNDNPLHKAFVHNYLRMQPYQLDRLWYRLIFSGTGARPEEVSSIDEMLERVRTTPGAIGYVDSSIIEQVDTSMMTVTTHE